METKAWRKEGHMKTKTEVGVKESQELPAMSRSSEEMRQGPSLEPFDHNLPASRTARL